MRIGIDARTLGELKTGIGYYTYTLVKEMAKRDYKIEFFLFSNKEILLDFELQNVHKIVDNKSKFKHKGTLWLLAETNRFIDEYKIDIFWGPCNVLPIIYKKNVKKVVTIHDLVCYKFPETMEKKNYYINRLLIPVSIRSADKIITISKSTEKDIIEIFKSKRVSTKLSVIYNPVNTMIVDEESEKKYFAKSNFDKNKYILYVGTIEPRKNVKILLDVCESLYKKTGLKIVLAGKMGWESEEVKSRIRNLSERGYLTYLGYIDEEEKAILMKNCFIFIFPSFYEGFGLPVVEALKYGAVVLVADTSSLKELVDEKALRFDWKDAKELEAKILYMYKDRNIYNLHKSICRKIASKFDNDTIVQQYIDLFYNLYQK